MGGLGCLRASAARISPWQSGKLFGDGLHPPVFCGVVRLLGLISP